MSADSRLQPIFHEGSKVSCVDVATVKILRPGHRVICVVNDVSWSLMNSSRSWDVKMAVMSLSLSSVQNLRFVFSL